MAQKKETAVVYSQEELAPGIFSMWIVTDIADEARPGQFISVYSQDGSRLLPRPISICEADPDEGRLRIVYRISGKGTDEFSKYVSGDPIDIMGPLGNGFPQEGENVFLIGGGIGWLSRPAPGKSVAGAPIPVRVAHVQQQDVPRYINGIGAVLSLHSVIIRPQIDGILTDIRVKEGQTVNAGDLLATLDDRSIKASLDQARAQLGQNQAQLQVALVDLKRYQL